MTMKVPVLPIPAGQCTTMGPASSGGRQCLYVSLPLFLCLSVSKSLYLGLLLSPCLFHFFLVSVSCVLCPVSVSCFCVLCPVSCFCVSVSLCPVSCVLFLY